jgi:hypothetical protein
VQICLLCRARQAGGAADPLSREIGVRVLVVQDSIGIVNTDSGEDSLYEKMGFLVVEEYREVDGYLPARAVRETRGMIYETYSPCFWEKSSAFPEMDTSVGLGEEENEVHGDDLAHHECNALI